jgi:glutathione S-transferase
MRLYDYPVAPNCRRVRIFLAEKGVCVPRQTIDLTDQEQLSPSYGAINPRCSVPALQLDDGTMITEVLAIWRYFEESAPQPPLLGRDAQDKALVTMWERRMELDGFLPGMEAVQNFLRSLRLRAFSGPRDDQQVSALLESTKSRLVDFFFDLDAHLSHSPFVAGAEFTAADITGFITLDFVAARLKLPIPDNHVHLRRWSEAIAARPSLHS